MFQQNIVITNEDNVNHHLDFKLVENNFKRWNLVSSKKRGGGGKIKSETPKNMGKNKKGFGIKKNFKRGNLLSKKKRGGGGRMKVQQPQLIRTIINRYAVLDKLQSESEIPHNRNWVSHATCMR